MTFEQVHAKLALLREQLEKLDRIPQATYEEFDADFRNLDSALRRLQVAIQVLIDLASFVLARRGLGTPSSSREILEQLEQAGHLPAGSVDRFGPIFGFRNRIVHLYDRIDSERVYAILTEERADLEELGRLLVDALGEA